VGPRNGIVIGLLRPAESQNKVGVPYEYKQNLSFDYNRIDQISILTFPLILRYIRFNLELIDQVWPCSAIACFLVKTRVL